MTKDARLMRGRTCRVMIEVDVVADFSLSLISGSAAEAVFLRIKPVVYHRGVRLKRINIDFP